MFRIQQREYWNRILSFWTPARLVWGLWIGLSISAICFVVVTSHSIPIIDDWALVPVVTGEQPFTLHWLWESHNEHRMVLAKAILTVLLRWTDGDFRSEAILNVCVLSVFAAGLIRGTKQLRGRTAYTDAIFPIALLHWAQIELYLGLLMLSHAISVVAAAILIWTICNSQGRPTVYETMIAGVCLVIIPISGAAGLPLVLAGVGWLAASVWIGFRKSAPAMERWTQSIVAVGGALLVVVYFNGLNDGKSFSQNFSIQQVATIATQATTMSLIPVQWSQKLWPMIGVLIPGLAALTAWRHLRELQSGDH